VSNLQCRTTVVSGLAVCDMLKSRFIVFGICECVLYMEILKMFEYRGSEPCEKLDFSGFEPHMLRILIYLKLHPVLVWCKRRGSLRFKSGLYRITLVKVRTLVQKVVTLVAGKRMLFRVHDDLSIFLWNDFSFHILVITQAVRSLTAEIAIKCYWKEFNSLIMLRICCEKEKMLERGSFTEMSTLIICVFLSHYVSHKTKNSNSAICDHGIHTSKVSY